MKPEHDLEVEMFKFYVYISQKTDFQSRFFVDINKLKK